MKGIAIVIGINIIALVGIFFFFKKRIDKSLRTDAVVNTIREEVEQLIIELNQTTNRNVAIIEERINQLKEVIALADKQIKVLNREIRKSAKETDTYAHMKPNPVKIQKNAPSFEDETNSTREQALLLYSKGNSVESISKELRITVAEVELIISLSSRKG